MTGIDRATADPAAKGAVRTFSKLTAIQKGFAPIRCIPTRSKPNLPRQVLEGRKIYAYTPLGRIGIPADIAFAAQYLVCDGSGVGRSVRMSHGFL